MSIKDLDYATSLGTERGSASSNSSYTSVTNRKQPSAKAQQQLVENDEVEIEHRGLRNHGQLPPYYYFFSVMVCVKDEVDSIVEFVQHYIEEGADQIFIFDDESKDGTIKALRDCVDSSVYTVYNHSHFAGGVFAKRGNERIKIKTIAGYKDIIFNPKLHQMQQKAYYLMYTEMGVGKRTRWLAVVDADEFITSRALPQYSIKELLQDQLHHCGAITSPWLLYSWGNTSTTLSNAARSSMYYRWGYDEKYALHSADPLSKFSNRHHGEWNKLIFQTRYVQYFHDVHAVQLFNHSASLPEPQGAPNVMQLQGATVCIPHNDTMLKCAADRAATLDFAAFERSVQGPHGAHKAYLDVNGDSQGLPGWCPFRNVFQAQRNFWRTLISEADIPGMLLLTFHYRIKSAADWHRKQSDARTDATSYQKASEREANRLDVFDDFMITSRQKSRANHADFVKAAEMVKRCPKKYFTSQNITRSGNSIATLTSLR